MFKNLFGAKKKELRVQLLAPMAQVPSRAHADDAGLDLSSVEDIIIEPKGRVCLHTGVAVEIPRGSFGLVSPRSSLNRAGVICPIGIVDAGYTGEVMVVLINMSEKMYRVRERDRVAQLVIVPFESAQAVVVSAIAAGSQRGSQGFGSSGR